MAESTTVSPILYFKLLLCFFLKEIILLLVMKDLDEDEMDPEDTGKGVNIRDRRVVIQSKKKTKW